MCCIKSKLSDFDFFGEFLEREGFSGALVDRYLVPMSAAIWSTEPARVFDYPVRTMVAFFQNHGMLQVKGRPQWRYIPGGSRTYIEAFERRWSAEVRTSSPIESIRRLGGGVAGVEVVPRGGEAEQFDRVVIATPGGGGPGPANAK